nr:8-oxo-dGTP diphosphatase [Bacillus manliponensis]
MMFKYTICFIKKEDEILLLNRKKKPAMGVWNGVGGKIEKDETPFESVIREILEETGIELKEVTHAGNLILQSSAGCTGIYLFIAELPKEVSLQTPVHTAEGILDWKPVQWILDKDNIGVISHLKHYLPKILDGELHLEHCVTYDTHTILNYYTHNLNEKSIAHI